MRPCAEWSVGGARTVFFFCSFFSTRFFWVAFRKPKFVGINFLFFNLNCINLNVFFYSCFFARNMRSRGARDGQSHIKTLAAATAAAVMVGGICRQSTAHTHTNTHNTHTREERRNITQKSRQSPGFFYTKKNVVMAIKNRMPRCTNFDV